MRASREKRADIIPVDTVINLMCAVAAKTGTGNPESSNLPIFNCTSGKTNPIYWSQIEDVAHEHIFKYPVEKMLWYPSGSFKSSAIVDETAKLFLNWIPALILDLILLVLRQKPFLLRITSRMIKATNALRYFSTRDWQWHVKNSEILEKSLSDADRRIFNFDISSVDWNTFLEKYVLGTRRYVLKLSDDSLPECQRKLQRFYYAHLALCSGLFSIVSYFIMYTIF